jgi:2-polyprenyl-6-methoxyphenol hydroxylase-like FAD-dependent oxidoreductase
MNAQLPVLIAGAGPTGLALAIELARRGVPVTVVEKAATPPNGIRGKGIQPRTLEVFDDLGVIDDFLAAGGDYPPIRMNVGPLPVFRSRMHRHNEPTADVPYPNILMVPQFRTEEILRARLAELGGHVEWGTELVDLGQDETGVVVSLERDGVREDVWAAYVVAADGGRSPVRKLLGVGFEGETHEEERMLLADVRLEGLDTSHWNVWLNPLRRNKLGVALCPLPGTDLFQLTAPIESGETPELTLETFQQVLRDRTYRKGIRITELVWSSIYRVNVRMVDRYRVGRVFLAGDAAHVHSPAGGQGLNTGVGDAYNLGWKLAAVLDGAPEELLDTYEAERLPIAAWVLGLSTTYLRGARSTKGLKRGKETDQLDLTYRGGPLAIDDRAEPGTVQAGDRAPDGRLDDGRRLFDLFRGPHATLLAFGDGWDVAGAYAVTSNEIRAAYGLGEGERRLVLVRPDGYVGIVTDDPQAVQNYLKRISSPG